MLVTVILALLANVFAYVTALVSYFFVVDPSITLMVPLFDILILFVWLSRDLITSDENWVLSTLSHEVLASVNSPDGAPVSK